ncbi:Uncharacterised protein [Bordetella pertussis]|nr:Uncharacterised protein [Bordetella pertussis]
MPESGARSVASMRSSVVLPTPLAPMMATFSPASTMAEKSRMTGWSYDLDSFSIVTARRCMTLFCSKRMYGFWRDEDLTSTWSALMRSICFRRDVAWRDLDLLAANRRTKSCSSTMRSLALALLAVRRSRAWVEASM